MSVLGVVLPADCDAEGAPLDWDCCRTCEGAGAWDATGTHFAKMHALTAPCDVCGGHGSLKAAALASKMWRPVDAAEHGLGGPGLSVSMNVSVARCEDCGHPASEGTWSEEDESLYTAEDGKMLLQLEVPIPAPWRVHYSACDEACRHEDGHGRVRPEVQARADAIPVGAALCFVAEDFEEAWRAVDVRRLSWPHDLRPEMLAVLCLRCWAARTPL